MKRDITYSQKHMKSATLLLACLLGAFTWTAAAQDTNALKTDLGVFEAQTGVVLIKAYSHIGEIAAGAEEITVRCKETTDASSGQVRYGLSIGLGSNPETRERILVDDSEIDSLLNGLNYLSKINNEITSLPGFEASYSTKAGLRVIATGLRRSGSVLYFVQYDVHPRIPLTAVQLPQLYDLIAQARKTITNLKADK